MQRLQFLILMSLLTTGKLVAHETFLRPLEHKVKVDQSFNVAVFTGNFDRSVFPMPEHSIDELELHTSAGSSTIDPIDWQRITSGSKWWVFKQKVVGKLGGIDQRDASLFKMSVQKPGSVVLAIDFERERIGMELEKYQTYLDTEAHDDTSLQEYGFSEPDDIIVEGYTKIGKAIIQVGDSITENVTQPVGQRIELVPLNHPQKVKKGGNMKLQVLHLGTPLPGQSISVSWEPGVFKDSMDQLQVYKSDQDGIISFPIKKAGIWWANTIYLEPADDEDDLDFVSLWGSLTFEIN